MLERVRLQDRVVRGGEQPEPSGGGAVDDVRTYDRALTPAQVRALP